MKLYVDFTTLIIVGGVLWYMCAPFFIKWTHFGDFIMRDSRGNIQNSDFNYNILIFMYVISPVILPIWLFTLGCMGGITMIDRGWKKSSPYVYRPIDKLVSLCYDSKKKNKKFIFDEDKT